MLTGRDAPHSSRTKRKTEPTEKENRGSAERYATPTPSAGAWNPRGKEGPRRPWRSPLRSREMQVVSCQAQLSSSPVVNSFWSAVIVAGVVRQQPPIQLAPSFIHFLASPTNLSSVQAVLALKVFVSAS